MYSCGENRETDSTKKEEVAVTKNEDLETRAKRHAEVRLGIAPTEKYQLAIHKEYLDGDNKTDAVILVNRLDFAKNEAAKSKNPVKQAELGFMGNYNYLFYYDGGLDKISPEIPIPSSPIAPLKVQFENISSENYKDIIIDYRVLNACFRNFYPVIEHTPRLVFQWKVFDGLNKPQKEAYCIQYDSGTLGIQKDILILKGRMKDPGKVDDIYHFDPEITPTSELLYRFFYYPKEGKYITKK
jgi:hypothetical protein